MASDYSSSFRILSYSIFRSRSSSTSTVVSSRSIRKGGRIEPQDDTGSKVFCSIFRHCYSITRLGACDINMWYKVVSAMWEPRDVHFGFECKFLILPEHLPQLDAAYSILRLLLRVTIYQTSEFLYDILHCLTYRPLVNKLC